MSKEKSIKAILLIVIATLIAVAAITTSNKIQNRKLATPATSVSPGEQLASEADYAAKIAAETGIFDGDHIFSRIGGAIRVAGAAGTFKADDFEKLDFSLPEEDKFGDDERYEIFNPSGPFKISPESYQLNFYPQLAKNLPSDLKPIFTMYRNTSNTGLIAETIYGVVPDITKEICERVDQKAILGSPPPIHPIQDGALVPPPALIGMGDGCVLDTKANRYYLFVTVVSRIKSAGGKWQL